MPSRKTTIAAQARAARMPSIPKELIDQFVTGPMSAEAVQEISSAFKKALIERALGAELSHHLGYPPGAAKPEDATNHRNGATAKTVLTEDGPVRIEVPRFSFVKREADGEVDFVSPVPCPFNYGSVPGAIAPDGDAPDALVLGPRVAAGAEVDAEEHGGWAALGLLARRRRG